MSKKNQIALVTGASSGIGKSVAVQLSKKGFEVIISSRNIDRLNETKDLIDSIVFDKFKNKLGKIKAIHNFGAGDILELDGNFKFMIRLEDVKDTNINIEEKKILLS